MSADRAALIHRFKVCLREEAGIPTFERRDPVIPAHPTLEDVVAGSSSSPAYLRCQKCRGELLSGIRSHICIYCGSHQRKDVLPPSMSFTSTVAYRGFLESLQLDGSEVASLNTDTDSSTSHHDAPKKELPLSELLDFKLEWPHGSDDIDKKDEKKVRIPSMNHVNLDGVDLENFFVKSATEIPQSTSVTSSSKEMVNIPSAEFHFDVPNAHDSAMEVVPEVGTISSWKAEFGPDTTGNEAIETNKTSFSPSIVDCSFNNLEATTGEAQNKEIHLAMDNNAKCDASGAIFSNDVFEDAILGSCMNDTNNINHTSSLDDWGKFSGHDETSFPIATTQDVILENDVKNKDNLDETKANGDALDDWQDFTNLRDALQPSPNSCPVTSGLLFDKSITNDKAIDVDRNIVQETSDSREGDALQAVGSTNNINSSPTKQFPFRGSDLDTFFGGSSQANRTNDLMNEDRDLVDDWRDFTSSDVSGSSLNLWPPASPPVSQQNLANSVHEIETINTKDVVAERTTNEGSGELLDISVKLYGNIEESRNSQMLPVSNSEFGVLFGGNSQGFINSSITRQTRDSLDNWENFAGPATVVGMTGDSKAKNDEPVELQKTLASNSEFDSLFVGLSQENDSGGLIKESDELTDDWQDFAGYGDVCAPSSNVWTASCSSISQEPNVMQEMETMDMIHVVPQKSTVGGCDAVVEICVGTEDNNNNNNKAFSHTSSDFDAFFGGTLQDHKGNGLTKDNNDSLDDWQEFAGYGDTSGSFLSAWPPSGSAVSWEPSKVTDYGNIIQEDSSINICHATIPETVDSGCNKLAQSTTDRKNKGSEPLNPLSFSHSVFDELFGGASQKDSSNNVTKESSDSFCDWQEFAGPQNMPGSSSGCSLAGSTISQAAVEQIHSRNLVKDVSKMENDDALDDEWQDFAGCGDMTGTSSSSAWYLNDSMVCQEASKQIESMNPSQEMDSTDYAHAAPFSDMHINGGSHSLNHLPTAFTDFDRVRDVEGKPDFGTSENPGRNLLATMTSISADSDVDGKVEMLISQMHDLSFMLDDQLRIPG